MLERLSRPKGVGAVFAYFFDLSARPSETTGPPGQDARRLIGSSGVRGGSPDSCRELDLPSSEPPNHPQQGPSAGSGMYKKNEIEDILKELRRMASEPSLPIDSESSLHTTFYFDRLIRQAHHQLVELKGLKAIALYDSSPDKKRKAVERAGTILKKKPGQQKELDDETVQWLTDKYNEWMSLLKFIQKAYAGYCEQGMSSKEALDKLAETPRLDFFSTRELDYIVNTTRRDYVLEMLECISGFKKDTLKDKIRTTKPR